jgi:Yippee zinc-binding/DNA-binding /Mis18, centromere assembly
MTWLDAFRSVATEPADDARESGVRGAGQRRRRALACVKCGSSVTDKAAMISVNGTRTHLFTNPDGYRFRIGCFASAHGLLGVGEPTDEYTWFPGFTWQVQTCSRCQEQIGWLYQSTDSASFYGLILSQRHTRSTS